MDVEEYFDVVEPALKSVYSSMSNTNITYDQFVDLHLANMSMVEILSPGFVHSYTVAVKKSTRNTVTVLGGVAVVISAASFFLGSICK
jgi:hypothetical protein